MSRIGKQPIPLAAGVEISLDQDQVLVKGKLGSPSRQILPGLAVQIESKQIMVSRSSEDRRTRSFHGLMRSLLSNMVVGVSEGYNKKLEMVGVGYRAELKGTDLVLQAGYSHQVIITPPAGVVFSVENNTSIMVSGIDKQQVGHMAAVIRRVRKPEPYKGKGIKYQDEIIRRKAGKAAKSGA